MDLGLARRWVLEGGSLVVVSWRIVVEIGLSWSEREGFCGRVSDKSEVHLMVKLLFGSLIGEVNKIGRFVSEVC